jgi:CheY-like chemotaxis protein
LDDQFDSQSKDQIIKLCIEKIKKDDFDLIILDFRLHPDDFDPISNRESSGLALLKAIKNYNPGIQVIIFTASNKVWNYTQLNKEWADGFIIKESPENALNSNSAFNAVNELIDCMEKCFDKLFLKDFYFNLDCLKRNLIPRADRKNYKRIDYPLPKEFVDESLKWFELSCEVLRKSKNDSMMAASFLFMFSVLENISNRVINVDEPIPVNGEKFQEFFFEFRGTDQKLKFFKKDVENVGYYKRTGYDLKTTRNIPWNFKILNSLYYISENKLNDVDISSLIKKRHDIVHLNSTTGDKFSISVDELVTLHDIIFKGLINIR